MILQGIETQRGSIRETRLEKEALWMSALCSTGEQPQAESDIQKIPEDLS